MLSFVCDAYLSIILFLRDVLTLLEEIEIILIQESSWGPVDFGTPALCWALGIQRLKILKQINNRTCKLTPGGFMTTPFNRFLMVY